MRSADAIEQLLSWGECALIYAVTSVGLAIAIVFARDFFAAEVRAQVDVELRARAAAPTYYSDDVDG